MKMLRSMKVILKTTAVVHKNSPGCLPVFLGWHLLETVQPFVMIFFSARILNLLTAGTTAENLFPWIIGCVSVAAALHLALRLLADVNLTYGQDLFVKLHEEMSRTMMQADYSELEKKELHEKYQEIEEAANVYWCGPWEIPGTLMNLITGIMMIVSAMVLSWPVFLPVKEGNFPWGVAAIIFLLAASTAYSFFSEQRLSGMKTGSVEEMVHENYVMDWLENYVLPDQAAKDVRLFQQQNYITEYRKRLSKIWDGERLAQYRRFEAKVQGVQALLAQGIIVVSYLVVGFRAVEGFFSVGSVVQYVGALSRLAEGIRTFVYALQHVVEQASYCQKFLDFLAEIQGNMIPVSNRGQGNIALASDGGHSFVFDHVNFTYPGSDKPALRDVSLTICEDEHLAVVGRNGSGKTTFVKLLCRLYKPQSGHIYLDGKDIWKYSEEEYWRLFGVVFQDFSLLSLPVGANIAVSEEYDEEKLDICLMKVGMREWVEALPHGKEEWMSSVEGVSPSGGQEQKLAIARALFRDAVFLVLDEPTAALDPKSEAAIYENFHKMSAGKGAVYISHRLSACRFCDRIAVFENGRVVQYGSHNELVLQKKGVYYALWEAQAQYYFI